MDKSSEVNTLLFSCRDVVTTALSATSPNRDSGGPVRPTWVEFCVGMCCP